MFVFAVKLKPRNAMRLLLPDSAIKKERKKEKQKVCFTAAPGLQGRGQEARFKTEECDFITSGYHQRRNQFPSSNSPRRSNNEEKTSPGVSEEELRLKQTPPDSPLRAPRCLIGSERAVQREEERAFRSDRCRIQNPATAIIHFIYKALFIHVAAESAAQSSNKDAPGEIKEDVQAVGYNSKICIKR